MINRILQRVLGSLRPPAAMEQSPDTMLESGLESLPMNVVLLDRDLRIRWLNSRSRSSVDLLANHLPTPPRELPGRHLEELCPLPEPIRDLLHVPVRLPRHFSCSGGGWRADFLLQPVLDDGERIARLLLVWELTPDSTAHGPEVRWSPVSHGRAPCTLRILPTPTPPDPSAPLPDAGPRSAPAFASW